MCAFKGRSNCSALITLRTMADECWHCLQNIQGLCSVSQGVTHDKVKSLCCPCSSSGRNFQLPFV